MKKRLQSALLTLMLFIMPFLAYGQSPPMGSASDFVLFSSTGAFDNTGASSVTGDIGSNVGTITGFPDPGTLIGDSYFANPTTVQAAADIGVLYGYLAAYPDGPVHGTTIVTETLTPNTHIFGGATTLDGILTLDAEGNSDALFIFKINGAMSTSVGAQVVLINGASSCNVFWQVNGLFTLGENAIFRGNVVANGGINMLEASSLIGRGLLSAGALTLQNNVVTLETGPVASVISAGGPVTFCDGGSVTLSGNDDGGTWSTGETTATITVTTAGDYYVTNTSSCGSVISNHIAVTINPLPTASVITAGGSLVLCGGAELILSGNVGGTWSTGATTASITVSAADDYFVTNTNGCVDVTSNHMIVTAGALPTASTITAGGALEFCAGETVVLSGNVDGTWSTGAVTATLTVTESGDYFVTNTNDCGDVTSNHFVVTVNPLATASVITAGGSLVLCEGSELVLSGNVGGTWNTGATTATITVTAAGDYFVTNTNGCGDVTSNHMIVTAGALPIASTITAGGALEFCDGETVVLSGNVDGTWSTGAVTATLTVTESGDYFVTNTNDCGDVTSNHFVVTVNPLATASVITAEGSLVLCEGSELVLSGNVDGTWSTGATTASITVTSAGDYSVENTNGCGTATSNHLVVIVNPLPVASFITAGSALTLCEGENVVLSGNVGGEWSSGATTATITVSAAGDYFVTNTNDCGTVTSNHLIVAINPLPVASVVVAVGATTFCTGENVVLSGNVDGTWSTGETTSSITVTSAGDYSVENTNGCGTVTSNQIAVTVYEQPEVPANQMTCEGSSISFSTGTSIEGLTYQWRRGSSILTDDENLFGSATATLTINSATVSDAASDYNVVISGPCSPYAAASVNVSLEVNTAPVILGQPYDQNACLDGCLESFLVVAIGDGLSYQWRRGTVDLSDGGNISGANFNRLRFSPVYASDTAYDYNVVVTGYCGTTISEDVSLLICNPGAPTNIAVENISNSVVIYPNPFSNTLNIVINEASKINSCELHIYNSLGEEVMVSTVTKPTTTLETNNLSHGVYFYKVISKTKLIQTGKLISVK